MSTEADPTSATTEAQTDAPVPHLIDGRDVVLAVDFTLSEVLVAETSPWRDGVLVMRHARLRYNHAERVWYRDMRAPDARELRPTLESMHWHWERSDVPILSVFRCRPGAHSKVYG